MTNHEYTATVYGLGEVIVGLKEDIVTEKALVENYRGLYHLKKEQIDHRNEQIAELKKRLENLREMYLDLKCPAEDPGDEYSKAGKTAPKTLADSLEMTEGEFSKAKSMDDTHTPDEIAQKLEVPSLAPCPNEKCSHLGAQPIPRSRPAGTIWEYRYECYCGTSGPWAEDEAKARALWNGLAELKRNNRDLEAITDSLIEERDNTIKASKKDRALAERVRERINAGYVIIFKGNLDKDQLSVGYKSEAELMRKDHE